MAHRFGPVRRGPQCPRNGQEAAADGWLTVSLVVCAALAAWKVFDLTCLIVWCMCAQRKSRTTQTTTGDNDNGQGRPAKTMTQVVDSGVMTEGHMLDPREMTVAVFPDGVRFHYRSCCVVKGKGRQARQLTACQICLRCSR
jgi:hypothetical protein